MSKPLSIVYLPIAELSHRSNNARSISRVKFQDLQASLKSWEWAEPVVVSKRDEVYRIISGHQRVLAAGELGHIEVPCVVREGMTQKQESALGIRLNRSSGTDVLEELAEVLADLDTNLQELAGFDDEAMSKLMADPFDETDEEKKPAKVPKFTSVQLRELAKSYHPAKQEPILEFCDWLDHV